MNSRKITVYFSQTSKKEYIETTATTWGELKRRIEGSISDKTCVLSGSKHILALDEAALPDTAFTIFVYPKESKGGMSSKKRPAKKAVKKAAKKAPKKAAPKKKKSSKKSVKSGSSKEKATLGAVVSSVEKKKIEEEQKMAEEANSIGHSLKGYK